MKAEVSFGLIILFAVVSSFVTCMITRDVVRPKAFQDGYKVGMEAGRGQLKTLTPGVTYELKIVGIPTIGWSEAYRMEGDTIGSYGSTKEDMTVRLPKDFKEGDQVVFTPLRGFEKIEK